MKFIIKILQSLFDVATKAGPIGIAIYFSIMAAIFATVVITLNILAANTKALYISTYEYTTPISYSVIEKYIESDKEGTDYLKEINWIK